MKTSLSSFFLMLALFLVLPATAQAKESAYDRIMRTGTIRCGYWVAAPLMAVDANTGQKSGFLYDLMMEAAKALELKVDWVEEVTTGSMFEGLGTRYDMICTGPFIYPTRAKVALYSQPAYIAPNNIYVRANDHRFDDNFAALNKKGVTFAGLDGDSSSIQAKQDFPEASLASVPQTSSAADRILMVTTGKADAAILEVSVANNYMQDNPGKIRPAFSKPYKTFGASFAFAKEEHALKALFDSTLVFLTGEGTIAKLIAKNQKAPGDILPPAPFYGNVVQEASK